MPQRLIWAGAALQIVLFQLIVWTLQGGDTLRAQALAATAAGVAVVMYLLYRRQTAAR